MDDFNPKAEQDRTYRLMFSTRDAAKILNKEEMKELTKIKRDHNNLRISEGRIYEFEYKSRVETEVHRQVNKAGEKHRHFKPRWLGQDKFNKQTHYRQAQRIVQHDHQKLLAHIDELEITAIEGLTARCQKNIDLKELPKKDFNRSADRRDGSDRRQQIDIERS